MIVYWWFPFIYDIYFQSIIQIFGFLYIYLQILHKYVYVKYIFTIFTEYIQRLLIILLIFIL
jgi:hypothetical protein